jgi:hypothetical protein
VVFDDILPEAPCGILFDVITSGGAFFVRIRRYTSGGAMWYSMSSLPEAPVFDDISFPEAPRGIRCHSGGAFFVRRYFRRHLFVFDVVTTRL